jgi:hypothetical protein
MPTSKFRYAIDGTGYVNTTTRDVPGQESFSLGETCKLAGDVTAVYCRAAAAVPAGVVGVTFTPEVIDPVTKQVTTPADCVVGAGTGYTADEPFAATATNNAYVGPYPGFQRGWVRKTAIGI